MVFVRRDETNELFNIQTMLGLRPVKGEVGLEIELEGNSFKKTSLAKGWSYHADGSLRGKDNAEYLLTKPVGFKEVPKLLDELWAMMKEHGTVVAPSNRTSVHVHLNVTEFHLNRLAAFMALYFASEEILTEYCGEHRVGNLFALRAKDAPAIVTNAARFISSDMDYHFHEGHHYGALGLDAIRRHGSLEIRTLRGVDDPEIIKDWVRILQKLYEKSAEYPDPRTICEKFSGIGPIAFFEDIFEKEVGTIQKGADLPDDFIRQSLYEGMRMYAQDICFAKDWSLFKPVDAKPDPFGRDPRKKLNTYYEQAISDLNDIQDSDLNDIQEAQVQVQSAPFTLNATNPFVNNNTPPQAMWQTAEFPTEAEPNWGLGQDF